MSQDSYCDLGVFMDSTSFPTNDKEKDDTFHNLRKSPPSYKIHHVPSPKCKHNGVISRDLNKITCTTNAYSNNITNHVLSTYFNNFTAAVNNHDFLPVMLQANSGENWSVTNNIHLLRDLKKMKLHYIGDIESRIICTALSNYYMTADDGKIIKVPKFYSSQSSEIVNIPQDICNSHKSYSIFTKEYDTETQKKRLTFYSKSGINKATILLEEHNGLWFLADNAQTKEIYNKIFNMPDDAVYSISGVVLHDLWHNQLWHTNHDITKDIHKYCEGIQNLKFHNPLFKCSGCTPNTIKRVQWYNKNPAWEKQPEERFNISFGSVKSTDCTGKEKVETSKEGVIHYTY